MAYSELPICSSRQLTATLRRLGCEPRRKSKGGSHSVYQRRRTDGRILVSPVILGRKEIPKGTLRNILALLEISHSDFLAKFR